MSDTEAPSRRAPSDPAASEGPEPAGESAGADVITVDDGDDEGRFETTPRGVVVLAVVAIAAGLVLRFVTRSALWLDEALTVNISRLPVGQIPHALRQDGHPPLFYVLLHFWMDLFGTGDFAVRALAGVIALATLPLAWVIGQRRGGRRLAWIFTAVMALAPFGLRYATEARMYSLLMLEVMALYLLLDDVVRRERAGWLRFVGIALLSGALLWTQYWALWLLGAVVLGLAWRWWRGPTSARRRLVATLVAIAVGGVTFLPWVPSFLYQAKHTGTPWAGPVRPTSLVATTIQDFGGGAFRDAILVGAIMLALALLALFGLARDGRTIELDLRTRPRVRAEARVVALTLVLGAAVSLVGHTTYASRYASVLYPLFMLMVATGLTCFVGPRVLTGVFAAFLALCLLGAYWNVTFQRTQGRVDARAINQVAQPGDVVVFCPDQLGPAFSRSLRPGLDTMVYPTLAPPQRVDWVDYAKRNEAARPEAVAQRVVARAGSHQIFVVWEGAYRTLEGKCEALVDALGVARPGGRTLVPSGGSSYFEPATAVVFPSPR